MIIVKGNKQIELTKDVFTELIKNFDEVIVDLGTGDGRFVYKNALENRNKFYIGIDTLAKHMEEYSKKARKNKMENVLFVVGSLELLPQELIGITDKLFIILPWGSLLKSVVVTSEQNVKNISKMIKPEGNLEIILGYSIEQEPSETQRLGLPQKIDAKLIEGGLTYDFKQFGNLELLEYHMLTLQELGEIESNWAKRVTFGKERDFFRILFKKSSL